MRIHDLPRSIQMKASSVAGWVISSVPTIHETFRFHCRPKEAGVSRRVEFRYSRWGKEALRQRGLVGRQEQRLAVREVLAGAGQAGMETLEAERHL